MRRGFTALALVLVLAACAPFAEFARDLLDTSDGATLTYVFRTEATLPGLRFDPSGEAFDTVLVATGSEITLLAAPSGLASCVTSEDARRITCELGALNQAGRRALDSPVTINLTGSGVLASASYRRASSDVPRVVYVRDP